MNKDLLIDFIGWLEEQKNVYLVDLYYHNKDGTGMFEDLSEVGSLFDQYLCRSSENLM